MKKTTVMSVMMKSTFAVLAILTLGFLRPVRAQEKVVTLSFSPSVDDYAPVIKQDLTDIYNAGGGTLKVEYGLYPMKTAVSFARKDLKTVNIAIEGVKNPAGERPQFYCVADPGQTHLMFEVVGGIDVGAAPPAGCLSLSISGIEVVGNNVPVNRAASNVPGDDGVSALWVKIPWHDQPNNLNYGHPFMHHAKRDGTAFLLLDLKTVKIDDVVIREIYGEGIEIASYGTRLDQRTDSPSITNTKILNTWAWKDGFMMGDGIMLWQIKDPLIDHCVIYNDIPFTHWVGRAGIVVEHYSEGAVIQNSIIGGYSRNLHIEDTYGGHQVLNNKFLASSWGVFLNEPAWKNPALMALVKPDIIRGNYFQYDQERLVYKTFLWGDRGSFVDTFLKTPKLNGLQIIDNTFVYNDGKPLPKDPLVYIGISGKDYAGQGFIVQGNTFK